MQKFKLINNKTKEETICSLVTIDVFEYYVNDNEIIQKDFYIDFRSDGNKLEQFKTKEDWVLVGICDSKKVITTNNPNIDIPKVIEEIDLAFNYYNSNEQYKVSDSFHYTNGYNKAKETYQFTEEDMIDFAEWIADSKKHGYCKQLYEAMIVNKVQTTKELLQIFKEQQIKTIFYE